MGQMWAHQDSPTTLIDFRRFGRGPASWFHSPTARGTSLRHSHPSQNKAVYFVGASGFEPETFSTSKKRSTN